MGSQLGKTYSGLLHKVRLWVATAEFGAIATMSRSPFKPYLLDSVGSSKQQNTLLYAITAANTEVTQVGQDMGAYNASDKRPAQYRVWS